MSDGTDPTVETPTPPGLPNEQMRVFGLNGGGVLTTYTELYLSGEAVAPYNGVTPYPIGQPTVLSPDGGTVLTVAFYNGQYGIGIVNTESKEIVPTKTTLGKDFAFAFLGEKMFVVAANVRRHSFLLVDPKSGEVIKTIDAQEGTDFVHVMSISGIHNAVIKVERTKHTRTYTFVRENNGKIEDVKIAQLFNNAMIKEAFSWGEQLWVKRVTGTETGYDLHELVKVDNGVLQEDTLQMPQGFSLQNFTPIGEELYAVSEDGWGRTQVFKFDYDQKEFVPFSLFPKEIKGLNDLPYTINGFTQIDKSTLRISVRDPLTNLQFIIDYNTENNKRTVYYLTTKEINAKVEELEKKKIKEHTFTFNDQSGITHEVQYLLIGDKESHTEIAIYSSFGSPSFYGYGKGKKRTVIPILPGGNTSETKGFGHGNAFADEYLRRIMLDVLQKNEGGSVSVYGGSAAARTIMMAYLQLAQEDPEIAEKVKVTIQVPYLHPQGGNVDSHMYSDKEGNFVSELFPARLLDALIQEGVTINGDIAIAYAVDDPIVDYTQVEKFIEKLKKVITSGVKVVKSETGGHSAFATGTPGEVQLNEFRKR